MKVLWVEVGMVPRKPRASLLKSEHEVIETLEFSGARLFLKHKEILEYWIPKSDVVVICNAPTSTSMPLEFRRINEYTLAINRKLIRLEYIPNAANREFNIVDRPNNYSRGLLKKPNISIDDALIYVIEAYEGERTGLVLPKERQLFIFNNIVEVKPSDLSHLLANPTELQKISPRLFEELVADLLAADGWDVDLVARGNATGPDIIATTSRSIGGQRQQMIVECKRYREDRPVDIDVVRKVMYWVNDEYQATMGMIATSSRFTSIATEAVEHKHKWRLSLKDQMAISGWMRGAFQKPTNS